MDVHRFLHLSPAPLVSLREDLHRIFPSNFVLVPISTFSAGKEGLQYARVEADVLAFGVNLCIESPARHSLWRQTLPPLTEELE